MTTRITPRYEYRVWGDALDGIVARVQSLSDRIEAKESTDTYLVPHAFAGANPKLRDGSLDVKVLLAVEDGFERWVPQLTGTFPLDASWIRDEFFPVVDLQPAGLLSGSFSKDEFLDRVIDPCEGITTVTTVKRRHFYRINGCIAEIAHVEVSGRRVVTVAVESSDLGALREARDRTAVGSLPNLSYPSAIPRLLGWESREPTDWAGIRHG